MRDCVKLPLAPIPFLIAREQGHEADDRICLPFLKNTGNTALACSVTSLVISQLNIGPVICGLFHAQSAMPNTG